MPNVLNAVFPGSGPSVRGLQRVLVRQKFANHTVAFFDYAFNDKRQYVMPAENSPVLAKWGETPLGVETFYGYVNHYETATNEQEQALTRLVALGTSKVMNGANPNTWSGMTRSGMAREIAKHYRLRSVVHEHPHVVDNWATGPRSDFRSLKALADEAGFHLWVDGATLYFLDPVRVLQSAATLTVPRFTTEDIRRIQVLGGSNIPGEMTAAKRRVLYGLDYVTNEFFQATSGDWRNPTEVVTANINTFGEAEEITDAAARKEGEYFTLKATLKGNARLRPGALLALDSGRVNTDQSGLWFVNEAEHVITSTDFETKIVATRGADRLPLSRISTTVRGATEQSAAVVRDGSTWEAVLQEHVSV